MRINIHVYNHDDCEIVSLLREILAELKKKNSDDIIPQEIINKLDAIIADIKTTV